MGEVISHRDIWNMNVMFKARSHSLGQGDCECDSDSADKLITSHDATWQLRSKELVMISIKKSSSAVNVLSC